MKIIMKHDGTYFADKGEWYRFIRATVDHVSGEEMERLGDEVAGHDRDGQDLL